MLPWQVIPKWVKTAFTRSKSPSPTDNDNSKIQKRSSKPRSRHPSPAKNLTDEEVELHLVLAEVNEMANVSNSGSKDRAVRLAELYPGPFEFQRRQSRSRSSLRTKARSEVERDHHRVRKVVRGNPRVVIPAPTVRGSSKVSTPKLATPKLAAPRPSTPKPSIPKPSTAKPSTAKSPTPKPSLARQRAAEFTQKYPPEKIVPLPQYLRHVELYEEPGYMCPGASCPCSTWDEKTPAADVVGRSRSNSQNVFDGDVAWGTKRRKTAKVKRRVPDQGVMEM